MPHNKEPLRKRLWREGPLHLVLELLSSIMSPWLAAIGAGIFAVGSVVLAWLSRLDPLVLWFVLWVGILLTIGSSFWIANQSRLYRSRPMALTLPRLASNKALVGGTMAEAQPPTDEPPVALLASYTSKRRFRRTDTENGPKGDFHVIRCKLWNDSQKTIFNITVDLYCRSVNSTTLLPTDTGPVQVRSGGPLTLNPKQGIEFVLLSQDESDADIIYLGDHKDDNAGRVKIAHEEEITHFITVNVGAQDMVPTFKNFVAITLSPARLIALEYDSRRWGDHHQVPSFGFKDIPYQ